MTIFAGDIKLVASQVMDDVPEGGGAPTATAIADGVSNAIFPDISESDRAGGRVNLRKLHLSVQTPDTDTYMGANMIVAEPPSDPNVSVTMFKSGNTFDTREQASLRVESYLNKGPLWAGYLFENHIQGQRVIQLFQRPEETLPNIGQTLVLCYHEGELDEITQYVRTTAVLSVIRKFTEDGTTFDAAVVTCSLSDALRTDFAGSPPSKSFTVRADKTLTRDTVVADAGTYVGVVPLAVAADIGDFTVAAESMFTQLVPSSQTETPISDVRTNGFSTALVATGASVTQDINMGFTTSQNLFLGGPVYPGSLSITRDGVTLTDTGGLLMASGTEVGQVDYDNGIASLSTDVFGASGGSHVVTFVPAATPSLISDQRAVIITAENRSLSYTMTLDNIPVPRTLIISYLAQGRWYVLRDNGAGVLRGNAISFGVGTISYSTGSLSVTLGALPDVGSALLVQSHSNVTTVGTSNSMLSNAGHAYVPINTDGLISEEKGAKTIKVGALSVTWMDSTLKTATDNGAGLLTGDATGTVDYAMGVVKISPNVLPVSGTAFTAVLDTRTTGVAVGVTLAAGDLGALNITPGSVSFDIDLIIHYTSAYPLQFSQRSVRVAVQDDMAGNLFFMDGSTEQVCGSINYAAGTISFGAVSPSNEDISGPAVYRQGGWWKSPWNEVMAGLSGNRTYTASASANVNYSNAVATTNTVTVSVSQYIIRSLMVPNYTLKGVNFALGATRYQELTDGTLNRDTNPLTGGGTPAGSVSGALGAVFLSSWPTGTPSLVTDWRGLIAPPSVGVAAPFSAFSTIFRTAASPLRPGSLSVLGTMLDGTTFNVTAGPDGKINGTRVKGRVNYEYGLVELYFVNPVGDTSVVADLSSLGLTSMPADLAMLTTLRYNAVSFSYLPLDADLLGIDPVRLPGDGRVPIFRPGGFAVIGNKLTTNPSAVSNGTAINCARTRLSRVRVIGADGAVINTGYTANLEAGIVTFTNVAGYSQPVRIEHRIEDMMLVTDVQINGTLTFGRPVTHNYPLGSFVSSALMLGDMKSRTSLVFDQATWDGVTFDDAMDGSTSLATFNDIDNPITTTNAGSLTERWALRFTSSTAFQIIGEHLGVISSGNINTTTAPINPRTGAAYFTVPETGWGTGWSVGNILRINTIGAQAPVWLVRTVQQGPETGSDYTFSILARGDVDNPL